MNFKGLSPEVIEFISNCIRSIEEIEVLVLVAESPSRSWTVAEVDQVIRSTPRSVQTRLENLRACGVLKRSENEGEKSYQFDPQTPAARETALRALRFYKTHRLEVIELIYSGPARTMMSFSDAFKIRGKKDDS